MAKTRKLIALAMAVLVMLSALVIGSFCISSKNDFQKNLTSMYQKYDAGFDRSLLEKDEFAIARLVVADYNGKKYGEIEKAVFKKNGFAVLQFDSSSSAKNAYAKMKADGMTVDADGFATLDAYALGEMHPIGAEKIGTKAFSKKFSMSKENILVAVIDTGVMLDHPDLKNRFYSSGYDFSSDGYATASYDKKLETSIYFHGTFVSGIIANNTMNNVKIVPYKTVPFGANDCETSAILASMSSAIDLGVDVINLSIGTYSSRDVLNSLVKTATKNGICVCASSGNKGAVVDSYPASFEDTITVGALNKNGDKIASYSCYGNTVDFVAIGSSVTSTMPTENGAGYGTYSGTSFSAPYITALCADIKSMNKGLTKNEVYQILCDFSVDMGDEGKDIYYGNGVPSIANIVYTDNESYEYRLPQGELSVYGYKDFTEKNQPWRLFREKIKSVNITTNEVGAYSFYGMTNAGFNDVKLNSVGSYAFYGCKKLSNQTFDIDVKKIGIGAFSNIRNDFTIYGYRNTPAESYALDDKITFSSLGCKHSYSREIIEPEVDREGYTLYTCLVCGNEYVGAYIPPEIIYSGKCGKDISYDLYNTGRLVIIGNGDMYSYENEQSPFYSFKDEITSVYIDGEVSSISPFAFAPCKFIKSFNSFTDTIKIIDSSVYSADSKTLFYAFSNEYKMPEEVEYFNPSAFINSSIDVNNNFTIENDLVYDKNQNIVMAMPSYNESVLTIENYLTINEYAFILTSYPSSLRASSENLNIEKYGIGYTYKNGFVKDEFEYYGYDSTSGFEYATQNGFKANSLNSGVCGEDLYWHFDLENGKLRIYGTGAMNKYANQQLIPWYDYLDRIESIVVENEVESLSIYSFFNENNVKSITVPASLSVVNSQTIWFGCKHVENLEITLGDGEIPDYGTNVRASSYKYSPWYPSRDCIKSITICEDIERIGKFAFRGFNALTEITLNNCIEIADYAFYEASNLEKIINYNKSTLYGSSSFSKAGSNLTLYGYSDSTTKDIADAKGLGFVSVGCDHTRGYIATGERAVCCYDSNVEFKCVDCQEALYNEYIYSNGNGHYVKASVLTQKELPIENAKVYVDGNLSAITNKYGRFVIDEVKCEEKHLIEVKKHNILVASAYVDTNGSNRTGDLVVQYGNFVKDNVINAKDYAYALKNGIDDKEILDYGKLEVNDSAFEINQKYSTQNPPTILSVYNEPSNEPNKEYRRSFLAEFNLGKDYIPVEAGFVYGKDMDDEFMCIENVGKKNAGGYELKKISGTEFTDSTYKFSYGSTAKTGKVGARFYIKYSNGVKEYITYSKVTTYFYE